METVVRLFELKVGDTFRFLGFTPIRTVVEKGITRIAFNGDKLRSTTTYSHHIVIKVEK